jgi:hypothetical protein
MLIAFTVKIFPLPTVFDLSLEEINQALQAGEPPALSTARALKRGPPDLFLTIARLPQAQQVR